MCMWKRIEQRKKVKQRGFEETEEEMLKKY